MLENDYLMKKQRKKSLNTRRKIGADIQDRIRNR